MPVIRSHNSTPNNSPLRRASAQNNSYFRQSPSKDQVISRSSLTSSIIDDQGLNPEDNDIALEDNVNVEETRKKAWCWKYLNKLNKRYKCSLCSRSMAKSWCGTSTTHFVKHLQNCHFHKLLPEERKSQFSNQKKLDSRAFFIDVKVLRRLILEYVIDQRLLFRNSTSKSFLKIIEYLNDQIINKLSTSSNTYRNEAIEFHVKKKCVVKEHFSNAKSKIHIFFDLWTAPNCKAVLAICAHWLDCDYKPKSALMTLKEVHGQHNDENIEFLIHEVIKDFDFENNIEYFVMITTTRRWSS